MLKILSAFGISIITSFVVITTWFLIFGYTTLPAIGGDLIALSQNGIYWLGVVIFSILFFIFFAFPISLMVLKNSSSNP